MQNFNIIQRRPTLFEDFESLVDSHRSDYVATMFAKWVSGRPKFNKIGMQFSQNWFGLQDVPKFNKIGV